MISSSASHAAVRPGRLISLYLMAFVFVVAARAQERPAITGIAFVRLSAADMKASQHFYRDLLGFEPAVHRGTAHYQVNGQQWFEITALAAAPEAGRLVEVGFTTRDAAAMEKYLRAHGVAIDRPLHDGRFEVRDPEGRLIEFVEGGTDPAPASPRATSRRLIHAGFVVRDRAVEDWFYHDLLGFHLFWEGGQKTGVTDWANMQVPDGSDCIEYMLRQAPKPPVRQLGIMNHIAFGTGKMESVQQQLRSNGCAGETCGVPQMGQEGKVGMNLYDPDLTRVEFIEFQPSGPDLGSPFHGIHPQEKEER